MDPDKKLISSDRLLQKFSKKRKHSQRTRDLLIARFTYYYRATGLTPSMAYGEADDEEEEGIRLARRKIIQRLDDFEEYMEARYAENTVRHSISTIRSFYKYKHIQLPEPDRTPRTPNTITVADLPGTDDIKRVLEIAKPREKAIVLHMASSGMRRSEVINLTLGDLVNAVSKYAKPSINELLTIYGNMPSWAENIGPLIWTVRQQKTGVTYTTFSSPESFHAILNMLDHRPPWDVNLSHPLFYSRSRKPLTFDNFTDIFRRLNDECKFGKGKDGFIFFKSHNLRKWFGNTLKKRIGYDETEKLLGHTDPNQTRGAYLKPDVEHLYDLYFQNLDCMTLTHDVEIHDRTSEKVQEQDERIKALEKDKQDMKEDLERVKQALEMKNKE